MSGKRAHTPEELLEEQAARERRELAQADAATQEAEERAARRRADKAGYLQARLAEQARADEQRR